MWSVVVVMPVVQADFGATRGAASLAFTCTMLGFGFGGVVMGKLSDRFGIVLAIMIGMGAMLLGYLGAGYAAALWQFNLMHFLIGLGAAATFGPLMTEASHWFDRHRGLAVTIAASGNYIAGTFWPTIVERGTAYAGWRATHIAIGIGCTVVMAVIVAILRWQIGSESMRSHEDAPPPRVDLQISTNALTTVLGIAAIACCVAMSMPQVHIVAYCGDLGYGVARGAEMLSLMLAFGIVSRIGSGFLADRIGGLRTLLVGSIAQGVALMFYLFFDGPDVAVHHLRDVRSVSGRHRAELCHHRAGIDALKCSRDPCWHRDLRIRAGHVVRRLDFRRHLRCDRLLCGSLSEWCRLECLEYRHRRGAVDTCAPAAPGFRLTASHS